MRIEFIVLALVLVFLAYKLVVYYYQEKQNNQPVSIEEKEENLFSYKSELHQLCGTHINAENKLEQLDAILVGVRKAGFTILRQFPITETNVVLFTRVEEGASIDGSMLNYEIETDMDYAITFDEDKSELKVTSSIFDTLDDKMIKNDFARVFITAYKKI